MRKVCTARNFGLHPSAPLAFGRDRIWPNLIWPSLFGRIWPNRIWPNLANFFLTEFGQTAFGHFFFWWGGGVFVVAPKGWGNELVGARRGGGPEGWGAQNFDCSLSLTGKFILSSLSGGSSR